MGEAARQLATGLADDWLTVEAAAALTGDSERTWQRNAAWEEKQARAASRASKAVMRPSELGGKPAWRVHRSIDARLTRFPTHATRDDRQRPALLTNHALHKVEQAYRKLRRLDEWRTLCDVCRDATEVELAGRIVAEAKRAEGNDFPISVRALQLWRRAYDAIDDDGQKRGVRGLIDGRGEEPSGIVAKVGRSQEAQDYFYSLYRTENKLSLAMSHRETLAEAKRRGWNWPTTISGTHKWIDQHDDIPFTFLCRHGKRAYSKRFMPYSEQDWDLVEPGQFYVADHHQVDFWVSYKGRQIRPWLTAIQDCGTRRIVGWRLGPAPHQEAILVALRMAFREAIPEVMRVDNGRDFTAKTITGLTKTECRVLRREYGPEWKTLVRRGRDHVTCDDPRWLGVTGELGVELIYAKPYSAWSKGTLERWFRTFEDQCGKLFSTYCGHTPAARPESLQLIREGYTGRGVDPLALVDGSAVPTLEQASERIGDYLTIYHAAAHQGVGMRGRSPQAAWSDAAHLRKAVEGELDCLISVRGLYKVGANGVHLTVCGTHLGYGARTAALRPWIGREVLLKVDIEYPSRCLAFEPGNRRLIAALDPNKRIHPLAKSDDLREASAAVNRNRKDMVDYAKKSARRTLDVSGVLERERREQAVALCATGTDDAHPNIVPVSCGFESQSMPVPTAFEAIPDVYANFDLSLLPSVAAEEPGDETLDPYAAFNLADLTEEVDES